jgi:hypothetical protein
MNYNRRSTRPDGLFYRDQRKLRGSTRGRAGLGVRPVAVVVVVVLLALLYWWLR